MNRQQRRYMEREGLKIQKQILREELKKMKKNPEKYKQDAIEFLEKHKIDIENGKTD